MNKKKIWIFIILIIILILSFSVKKLIDNKNINATQTNKEVQKDNKKDNKNKKCPKNYPVCAYSETILDYCPNCGVSKNIKTYKNPCLAKEIGAEVLYKGECKKNRYKPDGDIIGIDPEAKFESGLINEKTKKELERRIEKEKQAEADYYKNSPVCALSSLYPDCSNCKSIEFPKTYSNYKEAKENSPLILYKGTCDKTNVRKISKEITKPTNIYQKLAKKCELLDKDKKSCLDSLKQIKEGGYNMEYIIFNDEKCKNNDDFYKKEIFKTDNFSWYLCVVNNGIFSENLKKTCSTKNDPVCVYSESHLNCPGCGTIREIKTYKNACTSNFYGFKALLYKGECKKNRYNQNGDHIGEYPEARFKNKKDLIKEAKERIKKEEQTEKDYYKNSPVCALDDLTFNTTSKPKNYSSYEEAKKHHAFILYKGTCDKTNVTKTSKEQQNNKKEKQADENYYKNNPVCALHVTYPECLGCEPIIFPQTYKNYKEAKLDDIKKILHKGPCLEKEEI